MRGEKKRLITTNPRNPRLNFAYWELLDSRNYVEECSYLTGSQEAASISWTILCGILVEMITGGIVDYEHGKCIR